MLSEALIQDFQETSEGKVPVVTAKLSWLDWLGVAKVRLGIGRDRYTVSPGLYALGNPSPEAPVLVTANYKLSFDYLRKELIQRDAWILVLDTRGINVWCAAGKGTFGTNELIKQVQKAQLETIVTHRQLIVPQLGAPGIAAHTVKKTTGFKVIYGPVYARDLPEFFQAGKVATAAMRQVHFNWRDRLTVVPVDIMQNIKYLFIPGIIFFFLSGVQHRNFAWENLPLSGLSALYLLGLAFITGLLFTPLLLPFIPGRAFALKGGLSGSLVALLSLQFFNAFNSISLPEKLAWLLIITAMASFGAMNFTGASTFTSLSGVKKEMRIAVPIQIISFAAGCIIWTTMRFI